MACENRHSETFQACQIKRLAATFKLAVIGGEFSSLDWESGESERTMPHQGHPILQWCLSPGLEIRVHRDM